jgi:uncharacterized protein
MEKLEKLKQSIAQFKSAVIAFSGGVDSTFLARVAGEVLQKRVLLVTARSSTYPAREFLEAQRLAGLLQLPFQDIVSEETEIAGFVDNPPDRCYFCKRELFIKIRDIAREKGFEAIFDGSNLDDVCDYRPGRKALAELKIASPLCEAGLTKEDIRGYSRQLQLPTAEKPAFACLASRFPYGETITPVKLERVGKAEEALHDLGFVQFRVRNHGDCARVELAVAELEKGWTMRQQITAACKEAGFIYVAIDTQGYRTGAMNEALSPQCRGSAS